MSFDEVRLPTNVERGASGGPGFSTTVNELSSGREQRNQNWSQSRGNWDIGYGIQSINDLQAVIAFFYARRGRARGFRFKDWADFEVTTQEHFATGDNSTTAFQLTYTYDDTVQTFTRTITKPVAGSVRIWVNSVEQVSGWTVDTTTGIVTFDAAPSDTHVIEWTGEWDVPVRFDTDDLAVSMEVFSAGAVPSISIVELRT